MTSGMDLRYGGSVPEVFCQDIRFKEARQKEDPGIFQPGSF